MSNMIPTLSTKRDAKGLLADNTDPTFSKHQIAYLEDLLINKKCMPALLKNKKSEDFKNCFECANQIEDILNNIRKQRKR